jgi:hypothetical protein
MLAKLIESNSYADPDRRGDAIERAIDDLTKLLGETRRTIHACNARIEREECAARAEAERAARARVTLVG